MCQIGYFLFPIVRLLGSVESAGASVVQLVVRIGERRHSDAVTAVLRVDKSIIAGINTYMGDTAFVGILEEDEVSRPKLIQVDGITPSIKLAACSRHFSQFEIVINPLD